MAMEQREFTRLDWRQEVVIGAPGGMGEARAFKNLSMAGALIQGPALAPIGGGCTLSFRAGSKSVEVTGRVVRVEDDAFAVQFTGVDVVGFEGLRRMLTLNADDPDRIDSEAQQHIGLRAAPERTV